ncbi:hAT dimerization domain-containing transposase-like protein [Tanacetum coccineum]
MITSQEWLETKWSKEPKGKQLKAYFLKDSFWKNIVYTLKLTRPLVSVLRMVDGERKPAMGYIYKAMQNDKDAICNSFPNRDDLYKKTIAAGFYLNPATFYDNKKEATSDKVKDALLSCIERLSPNTDLEDDVNRELVAYETAIGHFGRAVAIRQRKNMAPAYNVLHLIADWWIAYDASTPNLQKFAIKVLSLTCSATSCERNWGVFQHVKRRYNKEGNVDPIILNEIDDSNEWLTGRMEYDSEDGDDDSVYVDEEPSHFTRSTRQCDVGSSRARKGKGLAQTPVSSRPSKPLVLEDEDDMEEDIGVSCDEADEPVLEFDDDDFGDY